MAYTSLQQLKKDLVAEIQAPVQEELVLFEQFFHSALLTRIPLLTRILHFLLRRKGKRVRPLLVFLSAKACGEVTPATFRAAALIELLHTATLIHDDIVDESERRRGFFSLNALWGNKVAVLVGDFFLSRGLLLALHHKDYRLLEITSKAVQMMSEGELLQLEKARTLNLDKMIYYDIIRQKTASLLAACCESGAASVNAPDEKIERMRQFGEWLGMAFQIRDDLLDYEDQWSGKPKGIDLLEKKVTLPLLYALNKAPKKIRNHYIGLIKKKKKTDKELKAIMDWVRESGGIQHAREEMIHFARQAESILDTFPQTNSIEALRKFTNFVIERTY